MIPSEPDVLIRVLSSLRAPRLFSQQRLPLNVCDTPRLMHKTLNRVNTPQLAHDNISAHWGGLAARRWLPFQPHRYRKAGVRSPFGGPSFTNATCVFSLYYRRQWSLRLSAPPTAARPAAVRVAFEGHRPLLCCSRLCFPTVPDPFPLTKVRHECMSCSSLKLCSRTFGSGQAQVQRWWW